MIKELLSSETDLSEFVSLYNRLNIIFQINFTAGGDIVMVISPSGDWTGHPYRVPVESEIKFDCDDKFVGQYFWG